MLCLAHRRTALFDRLQVQPWHVIILCTTHNTTASSYHSQRQDARRHYRYAGIPASDRRVSHGIACHLILRFASSHLRAIIGVENCGLRQNNGTWWLYPHQPILFGGSSSTSGVLAGGSGILGFGMSNLPSTNDSFIGQYLASNPALTSFKIGVALNSANPGADTSPVGAFNPNASDSSAAAGVLHLYQPDPQYYVPPLVSLPTADADTTAQFGILPGQLGSYDWTVKIDGWQFSYGGSQATGGQGTFATIEMSYPYILLTQGDANKICEHADSAAAFVPSAEDSPHVPHANSQHGRRGTAIQCRPHSRDHLWVCRPR